MGACERHSGVGPAKATRSPYCRLRGVEPASVRWTEGFWGERFGLCRDVMIPSMRRALEDAENAAVLANFAAAAAVRRASDSLKAGAHRGTDWSDGDCYKWLEAAAHVYGVTRDEGLDELMDGLIEVIAEAQEADGYISTNVQLTGKGRWQDLRHHELYNMGHLMTAARVHHRATGKESFLSVARKLGDYLCRVFMPRPKELAHFGFNPSNIMGAVDLYRATGEGGYLELARLFVDMRGSAPGGSDQNQTRVPLREETEAVGHAVTAAYLWCGAADVCAETGEKTLLEALERLWRDVTERKMYLTGAIGALHHGESVRRDSVHEAFGAAYELPNRTAYNETCANVAGAMWSRRMLDLTGEAKYADVMEIVLYNSMLSGMDLGGTRFFYTNPLARRGRDVPLLDNDTPARWSTYRCYCCPPQVARTIAGLHEWAYGVSDEGVWLHLYGGSVFDEGDLRLVQETDYPWEGGVKIRVERAPAGPLSMMLRIPGWAEGALVGVNGRVVSEGRDAEPGTYATLERRWSPGDEVELTLPVAVRLVRAHPMVEETRNQVAVVRGPVVYCLESPDLPEGVGIDEVHIPRDIRLSPRHDRDLLGGVTVLEGEARRIPERDRRGRLYYDPGRRSGEPVRVTLIPYYAWCNRGASEMTVWMPLC